MKTKILTLLLVVLGIQVKAQSYCDFNNCLFWLPQSATVLGDTVNYATNQWSIDEWDNIDCNFPTTQCENLGLEVYYPSNIQPNEKRPLLLMIHGGGFIGGSKADFRDQAINFAKFGYVTATIDYRLCKRNNCLILQANPATLCNLNWGSDFAQSAYVAAHDGNAAIKFLKQNSEAYHIDTNNIIIGGHSAGALTAMLMAFTDQTEANAMGSGLSRCMGQFR
ncbi:MAG: alpha/beta hydrolase [Sphingobacteriales bacterium JAD_PAG50586_3]|nr:MAG: alpha/beta hydrolase [Sphingobacteriales bacterium JAD_PAG50586_3]